MRIICPTCASHYEVEADKIGATGQLVRCAQCREVWLVRAPEIDASASAPAFGAVTRAEPQGWFDRPASAPSSEVSCEPIDIQRARLRLRPRRDKIDTGQTIGRTLGGLAVSILCIGAVTAALGFRVAIVSRVPRTASLFEAVGLPVNPQGLALRDVRSVLVTEGDKTVLTLQGQIANLRPETTTVPALTVVVRGTDQTPLYTWTTPAPKAKLAKGETVEFRGRLAAPPPAGQDVQVSFADARSL